MNERKQKILSILSRGRLDLKEAAMELKVSEMTLRRDLRELEAKHFLIQVKGGAVPCAGGFEPKEWTCHVNQTQNNIAEALFQQIMPCQSVFLSAGRTVFAFAKLLMTGRAGRIKVITNSLSTASLLFHSPCQVILLGGELRGNHMDLIVTAAEKTLENYNVDWLISGCDAASVDDGFYTADISLANLETKSLQIAERCAIITESTKFGRRSFARFATMQDVDLLVTDSGLDDQDARLFQENNVEVIRVPAEN